MFAASFSDCFFHYRCKKFVAPVSENVYDAPAQHSFLSISFVNQAVVCGKCTARGVTARGVMCSLRVYQNGNQSSVLHV